MSGLFASNMTMGRRAGRWLDSVFLAGLSAVFVSTMAMAVQPDEMLEDKELEARARSISAQLRCVVCQNQSIDDSDAPLARDLRLLVRERLIAGDSNEAVRAYIVDRYGTFVLLSPPFALNTLLLWVLPFLVLMFGAWLAYRLVRRSQTAVASDAGKVELSDEERERLAKLLED